jgi:hypothetical protein
MCLAAAWGVAAFLTIRGAVSPDSEVVDYGSPSFERNVHGVFTRQIMRKGFHGTIAY